jgi:hypothetical protein
VVSALRVTGVASACVCAPTAWNSPQTDCSYLQIESDPATILQIAFQNGTCVCGQFVNPADGSAVPSPFADGSFISQPVAFGALNNTLPTLDATNEQPVPLNGSASSIVLVSAGRSLVLTVSQPGLYLFTSSSGQTLAANATNLTVVLPPSFLGGGTYFEMLAPNATARLQIFLTFVPLAVTPPPTIASTQVAAISSTAAVAGTALVGTVVYFGRAGRAFVAAPARLGGRRKFSL